MDKIMKNKRGLELVISWKKIQNQVKKVPLLAMYYLIKFNDVIQSGFWVIPKITSGTSCKPIHGINKLFYFHLFESGKHGKEEENYKNVNILRWNKKHFS